MASVAVALALVVLPQRAVAAQKAAVFPVDLLDTSGEGTSSAQQARIALATDELRRLVAASAAYDLVDTAPLAGPIADQRPSHGCNGCERDLGRSLGADTVFTAQVHKVSTLILSVQIQAVRVADGAKVAVGIADIRGDNDAAWLHGIRWLARHRLGLTEAG